MLKTIFLIFCCYLCVFKTSAADTIVYNNANALIKAGEYFEMLKANGNTYDTLTVVNAPFYKSDKPIPVFSIPDVNTWIRFSISNQTRTRNIYFFVEHFNISTIALYKLVNGKLVQVYKAGNAMLLPANNNVPNYIYNLSIPQDSSATFYFHLQSFHPVILTAYISSYKPVVKQTNNQFFTYRFILECCW